MIRLGRLVFDVFYVGVACLILIAVILSPDSKTNDQKEKQ